MKKSLTLAAALLAVGLAAAPAMAQYESHEAAPAEAHGEAQAVAAEAPAAGAAHGEAAAAEHGGGHHSMFTTGFAYAVINFALLVGLLVYLLRKPIAEALVGRREAVRKAIDEAKDAKEKAEKQLAEYRRRMDGLDAELAQLRGEIVGAGEREKDALIAAAKAQAEKVLADAKLIGDQEVRRAKSEIREEMVRLAAELAHQKLVTAATADEREKQLNEFVSKLEAL